MNKINVPSPSNGIRLYWDDINYLLGFGSYNSGVYNAFVGILKAWGDNYIVQGCTDLGSNVVSAGWIMLDGELLKVDQHTSTDSYFEKITETNTTGDRDDSLGNSVNVYQQLRATATAATGNLTKTGVRLIDFSATDSRAGKIRIATQAEVNALSLTDVAMTPGRMANFLKGYQTLTVASTDDGPFNLTNLQAYVSVTRRDISNDNNFNLPAATQENRGRIVFFNIDTQDQPVLINETGGSNVYTVDDPGANHRQKEWVLVMSTGSTWVKINPDPVGWTSASILNGWAGTARYRLLQDFKVEIETFGLDGEVATDQTFMTLSPPFRPSNNRAFSVESSITTGDTTAKLVVESGGAFKLDADGVNLRSFDFKVDYYTK